MNYVTTIILGAVAVCTTVCGTILMASGHDASALIGLGGVAVGGIAGVSMPFAARSTTPTPTPTPTPVPTPAPVSVAVPAVVAPLIAGDAAAAATIV